jgi:hypothetical protein
MAEAVQAEIGAGIRVIGPEALNTIGNCVVTNIGRRNDVGRTKIAVGLRCADNRPADQCARDTEANGCAAIAAAGTTRSLPVAPLRLATSAAMLSAPQRLAWRDMAAWRRPARQL